MPPKRKSKIYLSRSLVKESPSPTSSSLSVPPRSPSKRHRTAQSTRRRTVTGKAANRETGKKIRAQQKLARIPCQNCVSGAEECWVGSNSTRCAFCVEAGKTKSLCGVDSTQYSIFGETSAPSPVPAEMVVPPSSWSDSSTLDQQNVNRRLAAMAANMEFLHKRLDDVVDDVTRLFSLRDEVAQNVKQLHETLIDA